MFNDSLRGFFVEAFELVFEALSIALFLGSASTLSAVLVLLDRVLSVAGKLEWLVR